jgi:hypothetical protein
MEIVKTEPQVIEELFPTPNLWEDGTAPLRLVLLSGNAPQLRIILNAETLLMRAPELPSIPSPMQLMVSYISVL